MKKYLKKVIVALILVGVFVSLQMAGLGDYLTLSSVQENASVLQSHVENNYAVAVTIYVTVYIVVVAFALPGASLLTLTGGFLFGAVLATLYTNVGATLGAIGAFLAARFIIGDWLQTKYAKPLKKFNDELERNGSSYLLSVRLLPLFPFFLVNTLAGLTKVRLGTFAWTTSLGIIPGSFVFAFAGQQLGTIESVGDVFSPEVIAAFVLLGLLSLVPTVINKIKAKKKKAN